jgi:predicted membrane channel-forming protein YqfA (hemolysin III family)
MALSYKARRRWALVILLVGMPIYVIVATTIISSLDRPAFWLELLIYLALGIIWILPFKFVFKGIGQPDPEATNDDNPR